MRLKIRIQYTDLIYGFTLVWIQKYETERPSYEGEELDAC